MRHADEREAIVVNAENRVPVEIDFVDVGGDAFWRKRRAEPQSPVLRGQREKMRQERGARAFVEALDSDGHHAASGWVAAKHGIATVIVLRPACIEEDREADPLLAALVDVLRE